MAQAGGSGMRAAGFKVGNDRTLFWATTFVPGPIRRCAEEERQMREDGDVHHRRPRRADRGRASREQQQDYFDIERILEWHQFGTYDRFIAHHKQLLARLNAMLPK